MMKCVNNCCSMKWPGITYATMAFLSTLVDSPRLKFCPRNWCQMSKRSSCHCTGFLCHCSVAHPRTKNLSWWLRRSRRRHGTGPGWRQAWPVWTWWLGSDPHRQWEKKSHLALAFSVLFWTFLRAMSWERQQQCTTWCCWGACAFLDLACTTGGRFS